METTYGATVSDAFPESYNPNALTTYKSIKDGVVTYPVIKTVDLEYLIHEADRMKVNFINVQSKIDRIVDNLNTDGWYNPNTDKEEVLSELCKIIGHVPTQSVSITATIEVSVSYEMPMDEVEDFDAQYWLQDNLTVDIYNGDSSIDSFDVQSADVDWNN